MKTFENIASLKLATLKEGQFVETGGYYSKGDGGGARYLIQTAAEFGGTPDGLLHHSIANGNVARLDSDIRAGSTTFDGENAADIGSFDLGSLQVNNSIYNGIVQRDAGKQWLHHNHLESTAIGSPITSGDIPAPPLFEGAKQSHTNVLAYWYQDFGIDAVRQAGGGLGWTGWYTWEWLFHGATGDGYESKRHPWLGYYRGDDANVLDWQCYWLNEAGVTGVILQAADRETTQATWGVSSSRDYWMYQMFNNSPNFQQLSYVMWAGADSGDVALDTEAKFDNVVAMYTAYKNVATMTKNGKTYPIVFAWEGEFWRGIYDSYSGDTNTRVFLKAQAAKFQAEGWDGVCVLARNSSATLIGDQDLEAGGVIYLDTEYGGQSFYNPALNGGITPSVTYDDLATGVDTSNGNAARYTVPCVTTDADSHSAHPSTWAWTGSTPALFQKMCTNMLARMAANDNPDILTVYNVSEWAEGGAALAPNMRDGKGYLSALKAALATKPTKTRSRNLYTKQAVKFLSAPSAPIDVQEDAYTIPVTVSFAWTSTASPVVRDLNPYDGKRIRITLDQSSPNGGPITLEDIGTRAASGLRLTAATVALGRNDSIELEYDEAQALWIQSSVVVNVL